MKGKKDHDSDEEHNETIDEIVPSSTQVIDNPISPPSQTPPKQTKRRLADCMTIPYNSMDDPEEGILFEEQSQEIK